MKSTFDKAVDCMLVVLAAVVIGWAVMLVARVEELIDLLEKVTK